MKAAARVWPFFLLFLVCIMVYPLITHNYLSISSFNIAGNRWILTISYLGTSSQSYIHYILLECELEYSLKLNRWKPIDVIISSHLATINYILPKNAWHLKGCGLLEFLISIIKCSSALLVWWWHQIRSPMDTALPLLPCTSMEYVSCMEWWASQSRNWHLQHRLAGLNGITCNSSHFATSLRRSPQVQIWTVWHG